jgi:parallel beta-helix repeat protein
MKQKSIFVLKATIAIAITLAFVMPSATAFANIKTMETPINKNNMLDKANIDDQPLPPMYHNYFYGAISINGTPAPIGTKVNARGPSPIQNGTNNPLYTTQVGYYGVPDPKLDCAGVNAPDGLIITFWINDEPSGEFAVFHRGATTQLNLTAGVNDPPYVPTNPNPPNGVTGVSPNVTLSWSGGDPDGDPVTYNVYFGNTTPPPQVAWNQSGTIYDPPGDLNEKSLYYWQIVAWDNQSHSTPGPIWSFITFGPPGVIYVDDDRPPEWYGHWNVHTIQEGVNNASSGEFDTVYVFPGTYREHVTVNKQVEMFGVSKETVIIDGSGTGNVMYVTQSRLNISGFTMMNGSNGILLLSSPPYVNNVTITDCNAFGNTRCGIDISRATDSSVINCSAHDNVNLVGTTTVGIGIYALVCARCDIIGCDVYNNSGSTSPTPAPLYSGCGIFLSASSDCTLRDNALYNNQYNFRMMGNALGYYENHDIDTSNTINGKPLYYMVDEADTVLDGDVTDVGLAVLVHCTNITVKNVETSNSGAGIMLIGTMYSLITDCSFSKNVYGVYLYVRSAYNQITNCTVFSSNNVEGCGIRTQDDSSYNEIRNCTIYNNYQTGYWSQGTVNNSIIGCTVYNNGLAGSTSYYGGIRFDYQTHYNLVKDCNIYGNRYGAVCYSYCNGNSIYHNNVLNNGVNAYDGCTGTYVNIWDNGSTGNYWGDYTGVDANGDGIGDTPYNIPGKTPPSQDRYPLMVPMDSVPPWITDVQATPEVQSTNESVNITCTVTDNLGLINVVRVHINGPEGFTLDAVMNNGSYYYEDTYPTLGVYYYYIQANDTSGNIAVSDIYSFIITEFDKPTSAVNHLPLWRMTIPFTVTATAYDNSGVANVTLWSRYSSNGTSWTPWTSYGTDEMAPWSWSFTGSDGYYQFYSIAVDDYGNVEDAPGTADASTGIDTVKPITTIGLTGTMGGNNYYTSSVTVSLTATDTMSGVDLTWYQIDETYWVIYSAPFTVSSDGQHMIQYYSIDHAGNQEVTSAITFKIDKIVPTTNHTLQGLIGSQGWFVTNVTVTLNASDVTSGVNFTMYKLNTADWTVYAGSFIVVADGNNTLYYYSVDFAGNIEATKQVAFRIQYDVTPPVTTTEFDGTTGENDWFVSAVTVTLSSVDDSAGVNFTKYKLDAGVWMMYTGPFYFSEDGEHTLYYYSVDNVGNREENKSAPFKIDQTAPMIDITVEQIGLLRWLVTANVSDETSGIAKVEFYLDDEFVGEVTQAPYEWVYIAPAQGSVAKAIVYDNAGNSAVSAEVQDYIPGDLVQGQNQNMPSQQNSQQILQRLLLQR